MENELKNSEQSINIHKQNLRIKSESQNQQLLPTKMIPTERTLFEKWTQKFEYDIDVIRHAYDITVDNTQKSAPKYTDRILENWYVAGLRTLDAIIEYENGKNKEKKEGSLKSFDGADFYEAALQRSFEELK